VWVFLLSDDELALDNHICKNCGGVVRVSKGETYHVKSFMKRCYGNRDTYAEVEIEENKA
jgi:hypothetical protein